MLVEVPAIVKIEKFRNAPSPKMVENDALMW